ncbi:MAG TPA: hypothetical protein VGJ45_31910 [Pseudonocardiaceae bacterium]|jgi:hypothetical protein
MSTTTTALVRPSRWDDGEFDDIDELRIPLDAWADPTVSIVAEFASERHIVRSID